MAGGRKASASRILSAGLFCALLTPGAALAERFRVEGDRLYFDTVSTENGEKRDIRGTDVDRMREQLRDNPDVGVLEITSKGGGHYASTKLAALVIDFELDTHVSDVCESSCVTVFLGGNGRSMARGARIGFHQLSWNAGAVSEYFEDNRTRRGWETPFDFAEWMYKDTQTETYNRLAYMMSRGVDAAFSIQTIRKPDESMWFPHRPILIAAGVLTQ